MTAIIDDFVALRAANVAAPSPDDLSEQLALTGFGC